MTFIINISSDHTDPELIQLYRSSGDLKILGELYQRYMELVYGVCLKYLKEPEDAKDCVLNIFEELIEKLKQHEVEYFRSWLYQLAKNHCLMKLRKDKKGVIVKIDPHLMQSHENVHLNGALEKEENLVQLQYCIQQLAPEHKKVIELFYMEGKCYNEISGATGLEWNKVRSAIQNGRRNLKICMEKQSIKSTM